MLLPEELADKYPVGYSVILSLILVIATVSLFFIARLLLKSLDTAGSREPPLLTAMATLGILGALALLGGLFTSNETAYTIAATVVGGFTGFITAQHVVDQADEEKKMVQPEPEVTEFDPALPSTIEVEEPEIDEEDNSGYPADEEPPEGEKE